MRRLVALAALMFVLLSACGGGGGEKGDDPVVLPPTDDQGLKLTVRHTEPVRTRSPVTWTLELRNTGNAPATLAFSSAQKGDVVLYQNGQERYRWSDGKSFTQDLSDTVVASGQAQPFELKEAVLNVAPGQYELVGVLTSGPAPPEVRQTVTVSG